MTGEAAGKAGRDDSKLRSGLTRFEAVAPEPDPEPGPEHDSVLAFAAALAGLFTGAREPATPRTTTIHRRAG
ncbi:MAG: hypothetical protein CML46_12440 [Rhodobacteraceae bacterium]|nr:hypothetical protein [Paracoccaceae bacterium]MBR27736.1 hypothetical protein [Paracoccaceae bacterium]